MDEETRARVTLLRHRLKMTDEQIIDLAVWYLDRIVTNEAQGKRFAMVDMKNGKPTGAFNYDSKGVLDALKSYDAR